MRVAYLHGFLGDPSVWDGIAPAGAIRLALPGHGGGPVRAAWAANQAAIADALGTCDVVVGYSLGARVALGLVAEGRVPRAVLISVNPGIADAERATRRASDAAWARRFRDEPLADVLDAWEAQPLFATQQHAPAAARQARRAHRLGLDPHALAASLEAMGLGEMPDYRAALDARCALIVGEHDAKFRALAGARPHVVIAGSGHDPTLEQPAALAAAVTGLL